jgi:hypothetical protein
MATLLFCEVLPLGFTSHVRPTREKPCDGRSAILSVPLVLRQTSVVVVCALLVLGGCSQGPTVEPLPEHRVEMTAKIDGEEYKLADDGNVYRMVDGGKRWSFHATVFDPEEIAKAYVEKDEITYRVAPDTGKHFETIREFTESFEELDKGVAGLKELVHEERNRWGSVTLQSPLVPSVPEYVELRQKIVAGESNFRDAIVAPSREQVHSGFNSLKCFAKAKTDDMVTTKSSLSSPLVYFKNGDDFWFEAYYFIEGARPMTLMDLECEFLEFHSGIRLCIFEDGHLGAELKALDKPKFRQAESQAIQFPMDRWVHVKVHWGLATSDGAIEIWQDNVKVIDTRGTTLPFRSAIYNSLEIGISAHSFGDEDCTLFVDDVRISPTPL